MRHGLRQGVELSVIVPFRDDEDVIGSAVRRISEHIRAHGLDFEVLAVDESSGDNSHAILALLRQEFPELAIIGARRGRGMIVGAQKANGRVLWLIDPHAAMTPLAAFGRAYRRVARGELDLLTVENRFTVCCRSHCLGSIASARGGRRSFHRRLVRQARTAHHDVEVQILGGPHRPARMARSPWSRWLGAIVPVRY